MGRVWICNTDVESEWALPENEQMPYKGIRQVIFNHFEEILLTCLDPFDTAILRKAPDPDFLKYIAHLGIDPPKILVTDENAVKPWLPTSQLAIENKILISTLSNEVSEGNIDTLKSFGVTRFVERIAELSGLNIPYSDSKLSKRISLKSFSRSIAKELSFRLPDGEECCSSEQILEIAQKVRKRNSNCPVVIKPDLGAAGKGQFLIHKDEDLDQLLKSFNKGKATEYNANYIIERWYPAATTLAYEFHIDRYGKLSNHNINLRKALIDKNGRDFGYIFPANIEEHVQTEIESASKKLAKKLWEDQHYHGPIRCDALLLPNGKLIPVLEMNARHSFFHFLDHLHKKLSNQGAGIFCWYFFRHRGTLKFESFIDKYIGKELLFNPQKKEGVMVPIWGTVTAVEESEEQGSDDSLRRIFFYIISKNHNKAVNFAKAVPEKLVNIYP